MRRSAAGGKETWPPMRGIGDMHRITRPRPNRNGQVGCAGGVCGRPRTNFRCVRRMPARPISVACSPQALRYRATAPVSAAFSFALGGCRGQIVPHAPNPCAKLQATRVRGPTRWQVPSSGLCRVIGNFFGGCDGAGASWPRSRLRPSRRHSDREADPDAGVSDVLERRSLCQRWRREGSRALYWGNGSKISKIAPRGLADAADRRPP